MNIYCAHTLVVAYGPHGYLDCPTCNKGWYSVDPAPFVVIGVTSKAEVCRYPFQKETE